MWLSRVWAVSKKHLRLRCHRCTRLLPAEHFTRTRGPLGTMVCVACRPMCVACGVRQPRDNFSGAASCTCDRCVAKEQVAKENVYFRYPVLKYRACPFSVDEMREELRSEEQLTVASQPPKSW